MNLNPENFSKKQKIIATVAAVLALVLLTLVILGAIIDANRVNLIKNGDFESWMFGKPSGWSIYNYKKDYEFDSSGVEYSKDKNEGINGKSSLYIDVAEDNDVRFYQTVKVKPETYYKITASFKIDGDIENGYGAGLSIYDHKITFSDAHSTTTGNKWVTYTVYGVTDKEQKSLQLAVGVGGFSAVSSGKIWVSNVTMQKVDTIPEGKDMYNLFTPASEDDDLHKPLLPPAISKLIFYISVIAVVIFVFLLVMRSNKKQKSKEELIAEGEWQPGMKVVNRSEIILMTVMTMAYFVFALYNLGDMKAPETYFTPESRSESVIISFEDEQEISRIMYHSNLSSLGENSTAYSIEYLNDEDEYVSLAELKDSGFYKWHFVDVKAKTNKVKITALHPGLKVSEFGFLSKDSKSGEFALIAPIEIEGITPGVSEELSPISEYEKWFDEQDTVVHYSSFMNSTYFDEVYFPRTAYENINGLTVYEITHPPLGKLIQAGGILVFGMNPFGWRIMGTLFGAMMIPLMFMIAKKMFNSTFFAFMAAALMMFDTMHFAQTRLATIDSYPLFFIMLMYYFMYDIFMCRSYEIKFKHYVLSLALCGISFGLGTSTKWVGFYAASGLAILFFLSKGMEIYNYRKLAVDTPEVKEEKWYKNYYTDNVALTILLCILFFIFIPVGIYCLSYIPYTYADGAKGSLLEIVWSNQKYMYNYHANLTAGHPFSSEWWQWIFDLRPIWYYDGKNAVEAGMRSTIASFGSPIIWWTGFMALFSACYIALKKADKKGIFMLVGYASQLLPWMLIFRASFIYHYFSCLPFLILFIVYVAKHLYDTKAVKKWVIVAFICVVALVFFIFYPAVSGMEVPAEYISLLKILPSWGF